MGEIYYANQSVIGEIIPTPEPRRTRSLIRDNFERRKVELTPVPAVYELAHTPVANGSVVIHHDGKHYVFGDDGYLLENDMFTGFYNHGKNYLTLMFKNVQTDPKPVTVDYEYST